MSSHITRILAAAAISFAASTTAVMADACSGHSHTTGTVIGAVGGGAIGSAASHGSLGGVLAGAAIGGLAGNAISRSADCHRRYSRHYHHYYRQSERSGY
jgi:uncharacterized protein YcfJ